MPSSLKQQEFDRQIDLSHIREYRKSGDLEILGRIYEKYMPLIYGVGLKYFSNRQQAQDLVTQVFEKLIKELQKHEVSNFKSWLYVIAKNHCLMELRKMKSEAIHLNKWQEEQDVVMEKGFELHPIDEDERLHSALKECIKKLKEEQRKSIELFYFQKKCYNEVAILLKIEEKKVKSYIQNGKRNLKICLQSTHAG